MRGIYTFILLLLGGMACASAQTKPITYDPSKESIFIFGADSYDFQLMFFRVKIIDDLTYKPSMFSPARFTGMATDGYIIGKSKAGESVGLLLISYYPPDDFMHY